MQDRDYYYIQDHQAKSIEDVLAYLYEQKKPELARTVCDLMRMSENWYARLQEVKEFHGEYKPPTQPNA